MPKVSSLPPDSDPTTSDYVPTLDIETMTTKRSLLSSLITLFFNNVPAGTIVPNGLYAGGGSSWVLQSYTPTYSNLTIGNGTATFKYTQVGNMIFFYFTFTLGSTSTVGAFPVKISLPFTYLNNGFSASFVSPISFGRNQWWAYDSSASTAYTNSFGVLYNDVGGTFTVATIANLNTTAPMTWATSDVMHITGYYFIA